ncbi:zinc-dependent metalloprotease [Pseudoclavibacter chungangensis]|uniref:Zinc-dependent metalloprotease n=1 Tax=Pseudoclavibacter chungangensis TaxID=587635 RepID=A0A7J5BPK3_9MICO|nr:zinc-dependent metalloprotease [Pseudoclavibacter chungangensis]KAB1655102.1 zinc-dependent metalloprotease [Pseudoclavibacter chungangensis]NYJ66128.1 putative hydrolase [Pseudoclavibacter chungangensis]
MPDDANTGDGPENDPGEELRRLLNDMLRSGGAIDPERLAGVAGLPDDPAAIRALMAQMQAALNNPDAGLDWEVARRQARQVAGAANRELTEDERARVDRNFRLAELWLGEATTLGELTSTPAAFTRLEWIGASMDLWQQLSEPVATSISDALVRVLAEQTPPELADVVSQGDAILRNVGGSMFAMQLGQVIGQLAGEVVSGGDIGVPVLAQGRAALVPQNVEGFGDGLDLAIDEVELYLAVRELAHARLFAHAKWLRLHLISSVTEFARGITIDVSRIEELARDLDPQQPEAIRDALQSGAFIPPRTPQQQAALDRLETMLALIEGWVDVVTQEATSRLPRAEAVAETVRRRRATGGPAERAFGSLVGLELRPRRLREAAAMWRAVQDAHGAEVRDSLWDHFDAVPTSDDIDHPDFLVQRLGMGEVAGDDLDAALASLLDDLDSFGDAPDGGSVDERGADGDDDASSENPQGPPV